MHGRRVDEPTPVCGRHGVHGLVQVAVVVPLDVVDAVGGDEARSSRSSRCARASGVGQVEHLLVAPLARRRRSAAAASTRGARARGRSPVDHLRLEPEAELACRARVRARRAGASPSGHTSASTYPVAEPARSWRRPRNQPSSSTKRSTPTPGGGVGERDSGRGRLSKYTASQVLSTTGRGRSGCAGGRAGSWRRRGARRGRRRWTKATSGRRTSRRGRARTSPGASSSPPPRTALWRPRLGSALGEVRVVPAPGGCTAQTSPDRSRTRPCRR